jgi:hypothetical protein
MAPEIIRRQPLSCAVDIYSLGATLYHILTGRPPFTAEKKEEVLELHLHSDPPNLQDYLADCSPNLAALIGRMMAKEPGARPSAAEVAAALRAESISFSSDIPGIAGAGGSTAGSDWQGILQKTRNTLLGSTVHISAASLSGWSKIFYAKNGTLRRLLWVFAIVLVLGGLVFWLYPAKSLPRQDRRAVNRLFPQAAKSYGTRTAGVVPAPAVRPAAVPTFSWKGKVDITGIGFAASQTGRYFYAIEDQRAVLIRADQFVGYKTAQQAIKDGKLPAP